MATQRTYDKWLKLAMDTDMVWTERNIISFRSFLNRYASIDQSHSLLEVFEQRENRAITHEHSEKGRKYLLAQSLKKNGSPRKHCKLKERELDILADPFMMHTLAGLDYFYHPFGGPPHFVPVYRATDSNGRSFDYTGVTYRQMRLI